MTWAPTCVQNPCLRLNYSNKLHGINIYFLCNTFRATHVGTCDEPIAKVKIVQHNDVKQSLLLIFVPSHRIVLGCLSLRLCDLVLPLKFTLLICVKKDKVSRLSSTSAHGTSFPDSLWRLSSCREAAVLPVYGQLHRSPISLTMMDAV